METLRGRDPLEEEVPAGRSFRLIVLPHVPITELLTADAMWSSPSSRLSCLPRHEDLLFSRKSLLVRYLVTEAKKATKTLDTSSCF